MYINQIFLLMIVSPKIKTDEFFLQNGKIFAIQCAPLQDLAELLAIEVGVSFYYCNIAVYL